MSDNKTITGHGLATPQQLADYLSVSKKTVQRLTKSGAIPVVRVGGKSPRYNIEDVVATLTVCEAE